MDTLSATFERLRREPTPDRSIEIAEGVGYLKETGVHADFIHFGSIGEGRHNDCLKFFQDSHDLRGGIYIGVAGLLNFSYIAAIRPDIVLLADINPLQTLFWDIVVAQLKKGENLDQFKAFLRDSERIVLQEAQKRFSDVTLVKKGCLSERFGLHGECDILTDRHHVYRGLGGASWLQRDDQPDHWWINEESFAFLSNMAQTDKLFPLTLDILDKEGCARIKQWLFTEKNGLGTIYASSIRKFLSTGEEWAGRRNIDASEEVFWENLLGLLPTSALYVIEDHALWRFEEKDAFLALSPQPVLKY